jgi:hypothetical protein
VSCFDLLSTPATQEHSTYHKKQKWEGSHLSSTRVNRYGHPTRLGNTGSDECSPRSLFLMGIRLRLSHHSTTRIFRIHLGTRDISCIKRIVCPPFPPKQASRLPIYMLLRYANADIKYSSAKRYMLTDSDMAIPILLEPNTIRHNPLPMLNSMFHNIPLIPHHPSPSTSRTKRRS